jgi:DNA-binding IclR family transcriptional regulator
MSSQPNQGLTDGLACLTALCAAGRPVGGRELARELDLHHVKVNRLLMTLAEMGILRQDEQRRYLPAAGLHVLAALAGHGSGLLRRARGVLADLHGHWPEATFAIGVRWRDRVAYLYHAGPGARALDAAGVPGLYLLEDSSIGQALLAAESEGADQATGEGLPVHGALVHERGGERHRSIAVPIWEAGQPIAAIAATGLPMTQRVAPVVRRLEKAASAIESASE